jgi:CRP-like cAMP-binding protein
MSVELYGLAEYFRREGWVKEYPKGHVICSQGDSFEYVYMIDAGMVKIYSLDAAGSERTITIFSRHNIFPIIWLMERPPPRHLYYYEAFTKVSCYVAPLRKVKEYISNRPDILLPLVDILTKAYLNFTGRIENLEKSHIHERMEFVLYMLAIRLGTVQDNIACIDALITQEDIASLAGVTRETMSVEINAARSKGLIWKHGHKTYINLGLLDIEAMPTVFTI